MKNGGTRSESQVQLLTGSSQPNSIEMQIASLLEAQRGARHILVLQSYPDPDAIASAYAHQLISAGYEIQVDIYYSGKISHQQNVAMVRMMGIELQTFDPENANLSRYAGAIYVDNQGTTAGEIVEALETAGVPALLVVDHHELQDRLRPQLADIRRTAGATSSIYAEYLEQGMVAMDSSRKEHVLVATALFHGILTDTGGFIRANTFDFQAAGYLSTYRNPDLLDQIMSQARSKRTMEVIRTALGERIITENYSIAGIGYLRAEDRDAIPQAADFLLTEENVHTAIVYGIVTEDERGERVIGSMRTTKITLDPDQFIKEVFGKNAIGQYFGGGKISAGGFEIPIGFLSGGDADEYRETKWKVFDNQIKQKIFAKIGSEHKRKEG
jgi:nanoRNase/pAp phosphatase (c-di-AMP/oligoRNAs hydrolase)